MTSDQAIGGEMVVTPDDLAPSGPDTAIPEFGLEHTLLCDTGRSAIRLALRHWRGRGGSGCIHLPDYLCPSVSEACVAEGHELRFYEDCPGGAELATPPMPAKGDMVLGVHYFGIANRGFLSWLDRQPAGRPWAILEDCVQAPYTADAGRSADYVVASLRKWWPAPDGAILESRWPLAESLEAADERFVSMRLAAKILRQDRGKAEEYLPLIEESEHLLSTSPPRRMSWLSRRMLSRQDVSRAHLARRDNWRRLADAFAADALAGAGLSALYSELGAGEIPLAFPVKVSGGRRDALRSHMMRHSIYCPIHWVIPAGDAVSRRTSALSGEILSLPIDQRYDAEDMDRLLFTIKCFFDGIGHK